MVFIRLNISFPRIVFSGATTAFIDAIPYISSSSQGVRGIAQAQGVNVPTGCSTCYVAFYNASRLRIECQRTGTGVPIINYTPLNWNALNGTDFSGAFLSASLIYATNQ